MKKSIPLSLLLIMLSIYALAQSEALSSKPTLRDRIYFGGGFGLDGGTDYFSVSFNPLVGYKITPPFSAGLGFTYNYIKYTALNPGRSINQYGINPFVRYNFNQLFLYGEYSLLSTNFIYSEQRKMIERLPLGLGYSYPLGERSSINVVGLYDVFYKPEGPFASPWVFRVFFSF